MLSSGMMVAALGACGGASSSVFPTATKLPEQDRQPDAIAVDLPSEPPPARDEAQADERIVALRTPLGMEAARDTVRAFFRAVVQEDMAGLSQVLRSGTTVHSAHAQGYGASRSSEREALSWWRERFRKHEYEQLAARVVYRDGDIETYRTDQTDALPAEVRHTAKAAPGGAQPTDLVLRVPIVTHSIRSERLLGNELFLWLQRVDDQYVIYHLAEPAQL